MRKLSFPAFEVAAPSRRPVRNRERGQGVAPLPSVLAQERPAGVLDGVAAPTPLRALPAQSVEELADVLGGVGDGGTVEVDDGHARGRDETCPK
jgi:hypothetical protein